MKKWSEYTKEEKRFWIVVTAIGVGVILYFNIQRAQNIKAQTPVAPVAPVVGPNPAPVETDDAGRSVVNIFQEVERDPRPKDPNTGKPLGYDDPNVGRDAAERFRAVERNPMPERGTYSPTQQQDFEKIRQQIGN